MSKKRIISIQDSNEELWDKARKQGYVWTKSESGFITKDELSSFQGLTTMWGKIFISHEAYGKTWALTKEELEK